ncbi:MAG: YdjY domain-containing protein [Thermodesulfobacteriota bacterium]|jgi:hypothetical protein
MTFFNLPCIRTVLLILLVLAAASPSALPPDARAQTGKLSPASPLSVDMGAGTVSFLAEVNPAMAGETLQHFAVFRDGGYADKALFKGHASPKMLYDALVLLGFRPGDNVTMKNWGYTRVEGEPLRVSVTFAGSAKTLDISDLVRDPGGRALDMRFGGNLKTAVGADSSGCLICLFSCPMGTVSNRDAFFKETGWWGKVKYRAQGLPQGERTAVITIGRR